MKVQPFLPRPSVLVEALVVLLASEVVESNGNGATAEWKAMVDGGWWMVDGGMSML